jgi:hypothetical protein
VRQIAAIAFSVAFTAGRNERSTSPLLASLRSRMKAMKEMPAIDTIALNSANVRSARPLATAGDSMTINGLR